MRPPRQAQSRANPIPREPCQRRPPLTGLSRHAFIPQAQVAAAEQVLTLSLYDLPALSQSLPRPENLILLSDALATFDRDSQEGTAIARGGNVTGFGKADYSSLINMLERVPHPLP